LTLGQRTTFAYDAADRTVEMCVANGARSSYTYDAAGQLLELHNLNSSLESLSSFTYT